MMSRVVFSLMANTLLLASGSKTEPCCNACEPGKEKYYSIPDPTEKNPQCGVCCLRPSLYRLWKLFEPKLLKGDCASQGFTHYVSTETDGVWPLSVTNDRYTHPSDRRLLHQVSSASKKGFCPNSLQAVYADMHDGDKKEVIISGSSMTIKPSGNNQTWVVNAQLDTKSCSAKINFNVPGKPSPPPVNLTATLWYSFTATQKKTEFEFTDPSGTIADKYYPLNRWVELSKKAEDTNRAVSLPPCHPGMDTVFADMHDGDKKAVTIVGTAMTIKPSGNNQTWVVRTHVDTKSCSASIDFNVPGKPGPPPVNLTASLFYSMSARESKTSFEFTDPSGKLAKADFPLNEWVQIGKGSVPADLEKFV